MGKGEGENGREWGEREVEAEREEKEGWMRDEGERNGERGGEVRDGGWREI